MSRTALFRKQHQEILAMKKTILGLLNTEDLPDTKNIRSLLAQLAGTLNVHLAMEDKGLYPKLLTNRDPDIQRITSLYVQEMQGLKDDFGAYIKKWPSSIAIGKKPDEFKSETRRIFKELDKRIKREDNELYYIVDRL